MLTSRTLAGEQVGKIKRRKRRHQMAMGMLSHPLFTDTTLSCKATANFCETSPHTRLQSEASEASFHVFMQERKMAAGTIVREHYIVSKVSRLSPEEIEAL